MKHAALDSDKLAPRKRSNNSMIMNNTVIGQTVTPVQNGRSASKSIDRLIRKNLKKAKRKEEAQEMH
jgi:hypothetical protein